MEVFPAVMPVPLHCFTNETKAPSEQTPQIKLQPIPPAKWRPQPQRGHQRAAASLMGKQRPGPSNHVSQCGLRTGTSLCLQSPRFKVFSRLPMSPPDHSYTTNHPTKSLFLQTPSHTRLPLLSIGAQL